MSNPITHVYPDTRAGVLAYLEQAHGTPQDLAQAIVWPDPEVRGVWKVRLVSGIEVIVYLAGYPDPWGVLREHNDHEEFE